MCRGAFERVVRDVVYCVRPASGFHRLGECDRDAEVVRIGERDGWSGVVGVAVVVNVVVEWSARTLFARSLTPEARPTTTNLYTVPARRGVDGTKLTERLFGLYETPPATELLSLDFTSVTVEVVNVAGFMSFENPAVRTGLIETPVEVLTGETPRIVGAALSTALAVLK